jgi:hypothetical protein
VRALAEAVTGEKALFARGFDRVWLPTRRLRLPWRASCASCRSCCVASSRSSR